MFLSIYRNIYAVNTMSEHISENDDAAAAPDIPMLNLNIRSQFIGMFINTAVKAAIFRAFVCVMPTRIERRAKKGKEKNNPKYASQDNS